MSDQAFSSSSLNLIRRFSFGEKRFGTILQIRLASARVTFLALWARNYHSMRTHRLGEEMSFNTGLAHFVCIVMSVLPPTVAFYSKVSKPEAGGVFA